MRKLITKFSLKFLKSSLSAIICVQLCLYPAFSHSNQNSSHSLASQKSEEQIKAFNENIDTLREKIFGDRNFQKGHPLDIFRLLDQSLPAKEAEAAKAAKDAKKAELEKKRAEAAAANKGKKGKVSKNSKKKEEPKDSFFTRQAKKTGKFLQTPSESLISPNNLLFEVRRRVKNKSKLGAVQSVISHGDQPIPNSILPKESQSLYAGNSHIVRDQNSHFTISHRQKVLHSFHQDISWIASFDRYVLFLDPNLETKDKLSISFIDLEYFSDALGKTKLPIFHIPVEKTSENKNIIDSLLQPNEIVSSEEAIQIGNFSLSKEEIFILSRLQELGFNAAVSFVEPDAQKIHVDNIKDIINNYKEVLEQGQEYESVKNSKQASASYENLKAIIDAYLKTHNDIGSTSNPSGSFAQTASLGRQLTDQQKSSEFFKQFSETLDADTKFQKELKAVADNSATQTKMISRFMTFLKGMTVPRPLGAPKIERALGLVAGTLRPGESMSSRWVLLKEGLAQTYSFKIPKYGTATLVGVAALAHPDVSYYFYQGLDMSSQWLLNMWEIVTVSADQTSASLRDYKTIPDAYVNDGRFPKLLTGVVSLGAIALGTVGLLHTSVNLFHLQKHLRSPEVKEHNKKVKKSFTQEFIDYENQEKTAFYKNLALAEMRKVGKEISFHLQGGEHFKILFKNASNSSQVQKSFLSNEALELTMDFVDEKGFPLSMHLVSKDRDTNIKSKEAIKVSFEHGNQRVERVFYFNEEQSTTSNLSRFFDIENSRLKEIKDSAISIKISNKDALYEGKINDIALTEKEENLLKKTFQEIEQDKNNNPSIFKRAWYKIKGKKADEFSAQVEGYKEEVSSVSEQDSLSAKEIATLGKAMANFLIGYSSLANTFQFLGMAWNYFFLVRNFIPRPNVLIGTLYFSGLFKNLYRKSHIGTVLNGAYRSRVASLSNIAFTPKEFRLIRNHFEDKIIDIEKHFLTLSSKQSYFHVATRLAASDKKAGNTLRNQNVSSDRFHKKHKITYEIFKRELLKQATRDFLKERLNLKGKSDKEIKTEILNELETEFWELKSELEQAQSYTNKKKLIEAFFKRSSLMSKLKLETKKESEKRLQKIIAEQNLYEKSYNLAHNASNFLLSRQLKLEKALNPKKSAVMDRFSTAEKYLQDPEALARATRSVSTSFLADTPIELGFLFLLYAGIAEGELLQVLHDKAFSENSLFYLGRFSIWYGFFSLFILGFLASVWMKVQLDSRLADLSGFDKMPSKADVKKRFGFLRWYLKEGMGDKKNSMWENYKFAIYIAWANFGAALITMSILQWSTLGRIDADIIITGYLMYFVTVFPALGLKMENAFEKSVNYVLKPFIEKGINFQGEQSRLKAHPEVQKFIIANSQTLRLKYNTILALGFANILQLFLQTFETIGTSIGPRAFQRIFFFGYTPTEHFVGFMDWMEGKGVPSGFTNACKAVFTRNRTDLVD